MDYPAWEVLTSLSEKSNSLGDSNVAARLFLTRWDSIFTKDNESNSSDGNRFHIFDTASLITEMMMILGNRTPESESLSQVPQWDYWRDRDLRIKRLIISGYRGIPSNDEKYYGLTFSDEPDEVNLDINCNGSSDLKGPGSYVIIGNNGSGKTSLYSAMELVLLNKTAIESKHKIKTTEKKDVFRHHYGDKNKPLFIQLTLVNGDVCPRMAISHPRFKKDISIKEHIDLSPFFCSESDLSMIECDGVEMKSYLDNTIGLGEMNKIKERLEDIKITIEDESTKIAQQLKKEQREATDEERDRTKTLNRLNSDSAELITAIENKMSEIRSDLLPQAQHIISSLLKDYETDDVELSFDSENGTEMFNGMLQLTTDKTHKINPRYYFNNFRFKLYIVSLKIAIAFYIMKSRKISFPLVFDDIFDSSDFTNRVNSKSFFNKIFKEFHDLAISNKPLQLIFFTQDEIIAESIYDGVCDLRIRTGNDLNSEKIYDSPRKVNLVQLFTPAEIKDMDKKLISIPSNNHSDNNTSEIIEVPFYNLYDLVKTNNKRLQ